MGYLKQPGSMHCDVFTLALLSAPHLVQCPPHNCFGPKLLEASCKSVFGNCVHLHLFWKLLKNNQKNFITVNNIICEKRTCIVHGNELISKMKSSNRLGFFSMARYGHPIRLKLYNVRKRFYIFQIFCGFFYEKYNKLCHHLMFCARSPAEGSPPRL